MGDVITKAATIKCADQGTITPASSAVSSVLLVGSDPVLVDSLQNSTVGSDCLQVPPPSSRVQCSKVVAQTAGASTVLFVGTKPVLLKNSAGTTKGVPNNTWSVSEAGQSVLVAD